MKEKLISFYRKMPLLFRSCIKVIQCYFYCLKKGRGFRAFQILWDVINNQSKLLVDEFYLQIENLDPAHPKKIEKLRSQTQGLHALLARDNSFSYSIIISVENPSPKAFKETLKSVLQLTAPNLEILVGYKQSESKETLKALDELQNEKITRVVCKDDESEKIINILADKAKGKYILWVGQEDLVRCDILFRYEQILRMSMDDHLVVYCKEYEIREHFSPLSKESDIAQALLMHLPYVFSPVIQHSLLIPTFLWKMVGGAGLVPSGLELFDIALKLDSAGAKFRYFPLPFYGYRNRLKRDLEGMHLLQDYAEKKGLDWSYFPGYTSSSYRAIPTLEKVPRVHVIIPYKNQKELTLKAVVSVLRQKGVHTVITAVDNGSDDRSIESRLEELGVEVLFVEEPFNYSRLNNFALKNAKRGTDCDLVLFLNNDVELDESAVEEMARWIYQPGIGMVGCRLNYPNGLLQHGGVYRVNTVSSEKIVWEHIEKKLKFSQLEYSNILGVVDGVTAACALMKKSVFLDVGGFDEIWYPICFSDTTLAEKLKDQGYRCFYTPYALGVHHESISRNLGNIEDVELSSWFYQQWTSSQGCRISKK